MHVSLIRHFSARAARATWKRHGTADHSGEYHMG